MKRIYKPTNRIEIDQYIEQIDNDFFSFTDHIRKKYDLSYETIKILTSIAFEELIALKMEKVIQMFNGKYTFPIYQVYHEYIRKAVFVLSQAYGTTIKQRKLLSILLMKRRPKIRYYSKIERIFTKAKYNIVDNPRQKRKFNSRGRFIPSNSKPELDISKNSENPENITEKKIK